MNVLKISDLTNCVIIANTKCEPDNFRAKVEEQMSVRLKEEAGVK